MKLSIYSFAHWKRFAVENDKIINLQKYWSSTEIGKKDEVLESL